METLPKAVGVCVSFCSAEFWCMKSEKCCQVLLWAFSPPRWKCDVKRYDESCDHLNMSKPMMCLCRWMGGLTVQRAFTHNYKTCSASVLKDTQTFSSCFWDQSDSLHHWCRYGAAVLDRRQWRGEVGGVGRLHHLFVSVYHIQVTVKLFPNLLGQLHKGNNKKCQCST